MATNFIPTVEVEMFDAEVHRAFQASQALKGTTRERHGVVGAKVHFPKVGKGMAQRRIPQTDVVPINAEYSRVAAVMEEWNAAEYTDIFDQKKVNFSERQELAYMVAQAMGRRVDQTKIDALSASGGVAVAVNIGGNNAGLNIAKLRRTKRIMDENNVPKTDRTFCHHARGLEDLLGTTEVTSSDFASVKALVNGEVDMFLGFKFICLGDYEEGGLPKNGNVRTNFAWHKSSVGVGVNMEEDTEINYIPEKTSWLVNRNWMGGAIAIDDKGIVKVNSYED